MAQSYSGADALTTLVHELGKLPGIGEKSATRLAYHLLNADGDQVKSLAEALVRAKTAIKLCGDCQTYTENDLCELCLDSKRERSQICVVERPADVRAIEAAGKFRGLYHVLHGTLSPVDGISPEQLKLKELLARMEKEGAVREIILALNPSVEGEATSLYIQRLLRPFGVKIFKIAYGLPMGGSLEFADRTTIGKAIDNRVECR
jgi:recombination protein RecR